MRKEFESELAKQVSGKKRLSKAWVMVALCAAILVSGAIAVTAVSAADQTRDRIQDPDQFRDGSCLDSDGDGIPDNLDGDGVCDNDCTCDCDGICDCPEDCNCVDCPCCVVE
jgi:hypothetical protein